MPLALLGGFYALGYTLTRSVFAAGVCAFVALFNAATLLPALGGHTNAANSIAFTAWCVVAAIQYVRSRRFAWLALFIVAEAAVGTYDLRWLPISTALSFVIATADEERPRGALPFVMLCGTFLLTAVATNLYWLLPKFLGSAPAPAPPPGNFNPDWVIRSSVISFSDALALWNPYFVNRFTRPPLLYDHVPWYGYIFPALVVLAAVASRKRVAAVAAFVYVAGAFLTKGALDPFGGLYLWAFQNIPLFDAYRDPSKFEVIAITGAAILSAFGAQAFVARRRLMVPFVVVLFAVCTALSAIAFDPNYGAVMTPREYSDSYRQLNARIAADPSFGRVLWLPAGSRWADPSLLHPMIDGTQIGASEFSYWLRTGRGAANDTSYVRSPLFRHLARVSAIKYVVIDDSIYSDATLSGLGIADPAIRDALSEWPNWRYAGTYGAATLYENTDPIAESWSSANAMLVTGPRRNAAALGLFPSRFSFEPFMFDSDDSWRVPYDLHVRLDDDAHRTPENTHIPLTDRLAASDSVYTGELTGDTVMQRQIALPRGQWSVAFAPVPSTLAGISLAQRAVVASAALGPRVSGTLVQPGYWGGILLYDVNGGQVPTNMGNAWRTAFGGKFALNVYNTLPSQARVKIRIPVFGTQAGLFLGNRLIASSENGVISASLNAPAGVSKLQLRASGLAFFQSPELSAEIGPSRGWDSVAVSPVGLFEAPHVVLNFGKLHSKFQHYLVAFQLRDPRTGARYLFVNGAVSDKLDIALREDIYYTLLSQQPLPDLALNDTIDYLELTGVGVSIAPGYWHLSEREKPEAFSVLVDRGLRQFVRLRHAEPIRPSAVTLRFPRGYERGILVATVNADASSGVRLALEVRSGSRSVWTIVDKAVPPSFRVDLATACEDAFPRSHAQVVGGVIIAPAGYDDDLKISNAFIANAHGSLAQQIRLKGQPLKATVAGPVTGILETTYGKGTVAGAVDFYRGKRVANTVQAQALGVVNVSKNIRLQTSHRWFIVSSAFDKGWHLRDSSGRAAVHVAAYGFLNAWYSPKGFRGTYELSYDPDRASAPGFFIGYGLVLLALLYVVTSWARGLRL